MQRNELIQKLPRDFAAKVVWGSRYPHHDATSAWDALARLRSANVPEPLIARIMGQNAADQFSVARLFAKPRCSIRLERAVLIQ
jgi:predicted TIM-barrel fold metal-dependent hydrolase